jgi:iron complex outermembrane receptor protein
VHISPSATLKYTISDTANVYATYATGFRSGGFNLGTSSASHLPYNAEKDQNFEIGAKTLWLDGRLGINADVFYMPQSNLLETEPDPAEPAFIGLYYLANIGSARTYGAEMQALFKATDWLNLGTSVGWLDDRLTSGASGEIPFTRNWTVNFTADAAYPLTSDVALVADADWRLEYGGQLDIPTVPYANLSNLDLDVGATFGQTRVVGYIDNAFNDIVYQFQYYDGAVNVNQGRTFGIRIEQKF